MSAFLKWHPSSEKGESLYLQRDKLIRDVYADPFPAFDSLQKHWRFGQISEIWDDYIFENIIRPVLDKNSKDEISRAVRRYSYIDHLLFKVYVRREENPVRFRRAFWNLNVYGQRISKRAAAHFDIPAVDTSSFNSQSLLSNSSRASRPKKIAFILKGPYKLAHVEFMHSFLQGSAIFASEVSISLILLDAQEHEPENIDHVKIISFAAIGDPFLKLKTYAGYCIANEFDHICWVACVQNLTLYMSMQLAPVQSYWSMKYHSIIMPSLQKYAGLGFGGKSFCFDDVEWFRGRAFPELSMPKPNIDLKTSTLKKHNIPPDSITVGCFVRAEKLYDQGFWGSVLKILSHSQKIHFVIASQYIPSGLNELLRSKLGKNVNQFHHIGWVDTKKWAYSLDIYYDSSPRGSCNTIFEAIEARIPVLMADSSHNRESSALPYLLSSAEALGLGTHVSGVFENESERCNECLEMINNKALRMEIIDKQQVLLKSLQGQKHLFAKDYLNFFLGLSMTLKNNSLVK